METKKFVERDKAIELIKMYKTDYAIREIERLSAVDIKTFTSADEAKRFKAETYGGKVARWMIVSDSRYPICSECKKQAIEGRLTDYCPHCGAYMT